MRIVVDTSHDITHLFKILSENIKKNNIKADCLLENYIIISGNGVKLKNIVAQTVAGYIIDNYERKMLYDIIRDFELLKTETEEITACIVNDKELISSRLKMLSDEIMPSISSGRVNIDGLLSFRLENYKNELRFTTEYLIDELMAKKSYDEFIGLMKYFTEIQSPVTDTVILTESSGEYVLTDLSGNPVMLKFDEEFAGELAPLGLSHEDLLISNLMAAMPRKIVFNNVNEDKPIINTINRIFEGRITH